MASSAPETLETPQEREASRLERVRTGALHDPGLRRAAVAGVLWLLAYALATQLTVDHPAARLVLGDLVYPVPIALALALSVLVARRTTGRRRRFWWLLVASNTLWLSGDLVWAGYAYLLHQDAPFPSPADVLYLGSYLLVPPAILLGFGGASGRRRARGLLDGALVVLGVGALGWSLLLAPQLDSGLSAAVLTGIAYPALGIVIVLTLVSVAFCGHRQVAPSVWLVAAAFAVSALTDAGYTWFASLHGYVSGDWLNLGWQVEAVLLCLAAVCAVRHEEGDGQVSLIGRDLAVVPVLAGVGSVLALAGQQAHRYGVPLSTQLIVAAVTIGLVARFQLSAADTRRVALKLDAALHEQQRLAVTDGLTGLYNRRFFEEVLRMESDRAAREHRPLALAVIDLDHFKAVNDRYGHQSGDAVLAEMASRLRRVLRSTDVLARYGGEEFVVLLPDADAEIALELVERCRRSMSEEPVRLFSGERTTITGSVGLACLHAGTTEVSQLIRHADRALYAAKERGRNCIVSADCIVGADQGRSDTDELLERKPFLRAVPEARLHGAATGAADRSA